MLHVRPSQWETGPGSASAVVWGEQGTFLLGFWGKDQCCFRNIKDLCTGKGMKDSSENIGCRLKDVKKNSSKETLKILHLRVERFLAFFSDFTSWDIVFSCQQG